MSVKVLFPLLAASPLIALSAEFAPLAVKKVNRPTYELSLAVDLGEEKEVSGMRIVSDPE